MAARARASESAVAKHRADASAVAVRQRAPSSGRGRRRRLSTWSRSLTWLGFGRNRERTAFEAELRELRLQAAAMRAEVSVLRYELEQAAALAAELGGRRLLRPPSLPIGQGSFTAVAVQREQYFYLDYSPDVVQVTADRVIEGEDAPAPDVIDLRDAPAGREIVLRVRQDAEPNELSQT